MERSYRKVKSDFPISYEFHDDEFVAFEKHTTGIGSKLMKKMGYQGKCLGTQGQGIINPIKVKELPHYAGLGYVRKEIGKNFDMGSNQPTTDDEIPSSQSSDSEGPMNTYQRNTRGNYPKVAPKVWRKKNRCSHYNKEGHQQTTSSMLHALETSLEAPKGEHVQQMDPPHSWWSALLIWFF